MKQDFDVNVTVVSDRYEERKVFPLVPSGVDYKLFYLHSMVFCVQANSTEYSPFPNLNFNVAHHGNYVVLASEPVCLVGVDVMTHEPVREESPVTFFEPFRQCYTQNEWNLVFSAGPHAGPLFDQFYRLWCLKEAYIKAVGIGLGFELARAEFSHPGGCIWSNVARMHIDEHEKPNWRFSLRKLGDDHWVCGKGTCKRGWRQLQGNLAAYRN